MNIVIEEIVENVLIEVSETPEEVIIVIEEGYVDAYSKSQTDALLLTKEATANKSTSTSDSASSVKFPVWSAILSYFSTSRIKTLLGQASSTVDGWLSSTDWITFNGKQNALGYTPENVANKDTNNGYCGLDSGGKVPIANLPTTLLKYIGVWSASTNTPTLTNPDTTKIGNVYNVSVAGTQFGIDFKLGDWLIYNASGVPEKSDNSDDVVSVNGQTGVVTITKSDVGLSNVDNTSDANKPISTAQQTALNLKANIANPTFTGNVQVPALQRTNGSGLYAVEDGTTLWHIAKWFTPTGTFSSSGTSVTTTGGQLTASMVGSKIGVGTDKRTITAFLTSNTCTVDSAFSSNYVSEPFANWGVYSRYVSITDTGFAFTRNHIGMTMTTMNPNDVNNFRVLAMSMDDNSFAMQTSGISLRSGGLFRWSNDGTYFGTKDTGLRRGSAGILEVYDGVTAGTLRDLRLRNLISTLSFYANDAAADADSTLPSGAFYKITGSRAVFQKP